MILRDEAKKSAQKSSEEAAIDVKLTVNLHFSSINCSGDNLCFIDPFQRYLKGKKWQINGVFENVLLGVLFWNSKFRESFQIFRKSVLQTVIQYAGARDFTRAGGAQDSFRDSAFSYDGASRFE